MHIVRITEHPPRAMLTNISPPQIRLDLQVDRAHPAPYTPTAELCNLSFCFTPRLCERGGGCIGAISSTRSCLYVGPPVIRASSRCLSQSLPSASPLTAAPQSPTVPAQRDCIDARRWNKLQPRAASVILENITEVSCFGVNFVINPRLFNFDGTLRKLLEGT